MLNESKYQEQVKNNQLFAYMQTAFASVSANKKNRSSIKSNIKKLKPKRMFSYDMESDKDVIEEIESIEKFMAKHDKKK